MKGKIIQYVCSTILIIPCFQAGFGIVWPSYAMPILQGDKSPIGYKISENEASLISSCNLLTPMVASMFAGTVADKIGRKKMSIACNLTLLLSWVFIITAKSVSQILVGRLLSGVATGCYIIILIVYLSELCQNSTRGTAMSIINFLFCLGCMVSYTLGWVCSYDVVCYFVMTLSVLFLVVMISYVKETPVFLVGKGREKEALNSLKFYRGTSTATPEILEELSYIRSQHKQNKQNYASDTEKPSKDETEKLNTENDHTPKQNAWKLILTTTSSRRALISQILLMILTVSMGMTSVQVYAAKLFQRMAPNLSADLCSIILALVLTISSCVATFLLDMFHRRTLMISSTFISSVCMAMLGSVLRWPWASDWVVTIIVIVYSLSYQVGPFNLPFVLTSESFGPQVKSVASQIVVAAMAISNFVQVLVFAPVVAQIGLDGTLFVFAGVGFFATVFFHFTMMETKGKLLEEVEQMYEKGFLYRNK